MQRTGSNMYDDTDTWNVFKGCNYGCVYCVPSFQRQSKRWGKNNCQDCYEYNPHFHPDRLDRIPSSDIIFVGGSADISFFPTDQVLQVIDRIKDHLEYCPDKTFYFQSKDPRTFERFKDELPEDNAVLLTTIETDKYYFPWENMHVQEIYQDGPKPPNPLLRLFIFNKISYSRKIVTVEPILDFTNQFKYRLADWGKVLEGIYIGYNSRPKEVDLPEPSILKTQDLIDYLVKNDVEVRGKDLRGCEVPKDK